MSDGLNRVMLIGNLGADPDLRYTPTGAAITTMNVAVNRTQSVGEGTEKRETVEWFSVVAWNKLAEVLGEHLTKGRRVYVEGRLQTRSYEKDGVKHYRTEVIANQVLFLDKAGGAGADGEEER